MASTNVETFAAELRVPAEVLLEQLRAAGVDKKTPSDPLSEADKERLLSALRASHGGGGENAPRRQKITVVRKQTSEIKQADYALTPGRYVGMPEPHPGGGSSQAHVREA